MEKLVGIQPSEDVRGGQSNSPTSGSGGGGSNKKKNKPRRRQRRRSPKNNDPVNEKKPQIESSLSGLKVFAPQLPTGTTVNSSDTTVMFHLHKSISEMRVVDLAIQSGGKSQQSIQKSSSKSQVGNKGKKNVMKEEKATTTTTTPKTNNSGRPLNNNNSRTSSNSGMKKSASGGSSLLMSQQGINYEPYWPCERIEEALTNRTAIQGRLRINPRSFEDAFVTDPVS